MNGHINYQLKHFENLSSFFKFSSPYFTLKGKKMHLRAHIFQMFMGKHALNKQLSF